MASTDERLAAEVLAAFTVDASAHFDRSLASMPLDDRQQRELRFWQRQSLAAVRAYAAAALPAALAAVSAAQRDAQESLAAAARTWDGSAARAAAAAHLDDDAGEPSAAPAEAASTDHLELRRRSVAARLASGA